jgi:PilZ domain-containing protein
MSSDVRDAAGASSGAPKTQGLRYRVGMAYPLEIAGQDESGCRFAESTHTQFIMRDGVTLVTARRLEPGSFVEIRRSHKKVASGQVVGQTGFTKSGNVYAVKVAGDPELLWGINFPELLEHDRVALTCLLACKSCRAQGVVQLTAVEYELLASSERVHRRCESCGDVSIWKRVPDSGLPSTQGKKADAKNRRRYSRVSVKLWGYIVEGGNEDSVPIVDMSRDGIRFRSSLKYEPDQVVQVAVAYMAGTANIFVPGRVVWCSGEENGEYQYGLRFMSRSPIM